MSPFWLILLIAPVLWWGMRHSIAPLPPRVKRWALVLRAGILLLLLLALGGVQHQTTSDRVSVIFALDGSASIAPEAAAAGQQWIENALPHQRAGDQATVLHFAANVTAAPDRLDAQGTNLAHLFEFAAALPSEGRLRRLVVLSDGYDTSGEANAAATRLRAQGIELYTVALENPFRPEVLIESFTLPSRLHQGEPFNATALLRSNVSTTLKASLYANGLLHAEQSVNVEPGTHPVEFRNLRPLQTTTTYELRIVPRDDTLEENNKMAQTILQRGEPRVLLLDPEPQRLEPLRLALLQNGLAAEVREISGMPRTMEEWQAFDAVVLSDFPALSLHRGGLAQLQAWVRDFGGGLAVLGGKEGFGDYRQTPLEAMLPVRLEHDDRAESPTVAMMIVLDSSGSMTAQVAGRTKMSLANQGAALALEVLQEKDLLGVTAVDSRVHEVVPLTRHENRERVRQAILRINAGGGGIYVYSSLIDAFERLKRTDARIRHVILFSDAADAEEKAAGEMPDGATLPGSALDLATTMANEKITLSTVGLGTPQDRDVTFLRQLAANGNGRFYLTNDALTLPQIFTSETLRVAQNPTVEEPFTVSVTGKGNAIAGLKWDEAPLLLGYNVTRLQPTAEQLLATEQGDPLLAIWRYGLGRVAAFTSDAKSRWAAEWLGWPGYGQFYSQLVRDLLRQQDGGAFQIETRREGAQLRVIVDTIDPQSGLYLNDLSLDAGALFPDGRKESAPVRQTAPGRYETLLPIAASGTTWITVATPSGQPHSLSYTPPWPAEYLHNGTNRDALTALAASAGGVAEPTPESVFAPADPGVEVRRSLAPLFLTLAILLLPLDVWLRRRDWGANWPA